jgi:hypothetical protein
MKRRRGGKEEGRIKTQSRERMIRGREMTRRIEV